MTPLRFAVLVYDGFDELDAIGPYEVLASVAALGAPVEVRLVTGAPGVARVTGGHGLEVGVQGSLEERFDWVVVAGGAWAARGPRGAWAEIERGELPRLLARLHAAGTRLAAVCTGAMLLSAAGLLRGRPAITHQVAVSALRDEGAQVVEARVVDDGDLVTAGGVTSGLDLALWLVERTCGAELAERAAKRMEHPRSPDVVRGPRSAER